jgi:hypothetical protein
MKKEVEYCCCADGNAMAAKHKEEEAAEAKVCHFVTVLLGLLQQKLINMSCVGSECVVSLGYHQVAHSSHYTLSPNHSNTPQWRTLSSASSNSLHFSLFKSQFLPHFSHHNHHFSTLNSYTRRMQNSMLVWTMEEEVSL